jgi:hypothetical protein
MTNENKHESELKDFRESFEAVIKPVVEWLNLKPDDSRSARFTFCFADVELTQGVMNTYTFDSSKLKRH